MVGESEHLLGARQRVFIFAELGGVTASQFNKFVDDTQVRRVGGSCKIGADTESIDGSASGRELQDLIFVEIAGRHDFGFFESGVIEYFADLAREFHQIAAVEPDTPEGFSEGSGETCATDGVVSIDQVDGRITEELLQPLEGFALGWKRLDPGVCRG